MFFLVFTIGGINYEAVESINVFTAKLFNLFPLFYMEGHVLFILNMFAMLYDKVVSYVVSCLVSYSRYREWAANVSRIAAKL